MDKNITLKTRKMLWGRAANRCAFPDCRMELVMNETETDDASIIGEECHIVAREDDGPRGDASFPIGKRNKYDNVILLCRIHHKRIDDQPNTYTVEKLKEMKKAHIEWIDSSLNFDKSKQKDDEAYSTYIEEWERKIDIENWEAWTSGFFGGGRPYLSIERAKHLQGLQSWLLSRVWPKRYSELEAAFENFRSVLNDFLLVFEKHSTECESEYRIKKFYDIDDYDPKKYHQLLEEYKFYTALLRDLILELTRSANYTCEKVRQYIDYNYRLKEGLLMIQTGPIMNWDLYDFVHKIYAPEYIGEERVLMPYPGLQEFKKIRVNRGMCFGAGVTVEDSKRYGITY